MVDVDEVNSQLKRLGVHGSFWGRPELRELPKILFSGEQIHYIIYGRYEGGFATLCVTNCRVLLVDKKPFYLTIEDMRYDMISDVQFNHRLVDSSIRLGAVTKTLTFTAYNHRRLREATSAIQEQVMIARQRQDQIAQQQSQPASPMEDSGQKGGAKNPNPVLNLIDQPNPTLNPYRPPVMIRRRVSRFY